MAATDRVQIFFTRNGDRFWTNVYNVNATTLAEAVAWANTILATTMSEQLGNMFSVVRTVVNHLADDTFASTPLSIPGGASGSFLPLFDTIKVNVSVAGFGRPDYKFIRGWLQEASTEDGLITDAAIAVVQGIFEGLIATSTAAGVDIVDSAGNVWETPAVQQAVQMRQLHRRRKKVVAP